MSETRSSHSTVHLAADAGGSSTRVVAVDESGRSLGHGTAGGGNPTASGTAAAAGALIAAAEAALASGSIDRARVGSLTVAMAGGTSGSDVWLADAAAAAGYPGPVRIEADLLATYLSGSLAPDGYGVVAGTGAIAIRLEGGRIAASSDGLGWLLGDRGSGFWVGRRVLRAVAAELDAARPGGTALTPAVLRMLGIAASRERDPASRPVMLAELVREVYARPPVDLARFARLAFDLAEEGDDTARSIVASAADALAETVAVVARPRPGAAPVSGPVVLGGSLLAHQPALAARVAAALAELGIDAPAVRVADGTVGAAVLALRAAGVPVDDRIRERIAATLAPLR